MCGNDFYFTNVSRRCLMQLLIYDLFQICANHIYFSFSTLQVSALNLAIINSFDYARQFHNTLNLGDCPHRRIITIKPGSASISTVFW